MKVFSIFLSVCLLFVLQPASAKSGDAPGPQSTASNPALALAEPSAEDVPVALEEHHSDHYEWLNVQGFWVQVRFPEEMSLSMIEHYTETLDLLNRQLKRSKGVLPETAIAKLQTRTNVFIKDDCTDGGSVSYWRDDDDDTGWIILHCFHYLRNQLNDAFHGGESVQGLRIWGHPGIILHELAHAWHDLFVDGGFHNNMIDDFYEHAVDCMGNTDTNDPYYWETDEAEFFADFSVMYYLTHWDPPSNVWEMQRKYRLLINRVWNEDVYQNWEDQLIECGS